MPLPPLVASCPNSHTSDSTSLRLASRKVRGIRHVYSRVHAHTSHDAKASPSPITLAPADAADVRATEHGRASWPLHAMLGQLR